MKSFRLDSMVKGWFVGDFSPAAFATDGCEVGVKTYLAGAQEAAHFHKIGSEITLVLSGRVRMAGGEFSAGDIVVLSPGEVSSFEALTDAQLVVVKVPGAKSDKFLVT